MPWIIEYDSVLERLSADGLQCNYPNGGAFGFPPEAATHIRGWIGPQDDSIKPAILPLTLQFPPPHAQNLVDALANVWQQHLPGKIWVLPVSHWSYELNFGSRDWMPALIESIDVDPGQLANRNNAAALEFDLAEIALLKRFCHRLLDMLLGSDFLIAFPRRAAVCTLHHHKQLWWVTSDEHLLSVLDSQLPTPTDEKSTSQATPVSQSTPN